MMAKSEDRAEAVGQLIAKAGGKLLSYYFTFGEYDFLAISEGLSNEGAATVAIVGAAGGGVADLKTTVAMTAGEMKNAFTNAGSIADSFRSAGTS
jgi:uncharacterized protein with GYD domain